MQNKKTKRTKADLKNAVASTGKATTSGSTDSKSPEVKKGVADAGKKGAHGKTNSKKGNRR